jgi:urease accessory protein UreE
MRPDGSTVIDTALTTIGATTRATGRPNNFVQGAFSTKILADEPIVAERPEYFNVPRFGVTVTGGHDTIAITEPKTTWYFAEGYNGPTQQTYIPIFNPNTTSSAHVTVTYMLANGDTVVDTGVTVIGPTTRVTARPYNFVTGAFSIKIVSSDLPIVPERVMYFNLPMFGSTVNDGTTTIGTTSPNTTWYFAGGNNGPTQQTYIPIQNPGNLAATLTVTYLLPNGDTVIDTTTISAGATSRVTARPYNFVTGDFATKIVSDKPVIAEEVVYFRNNMLGGIVDGGYVTIGASSVGKLWYFAEGYNSATQESQIAIGNPTNFPTALTITYMLPNGDTVIDTTITSVGANSRVTAFPRNFVQGAFSTQIQSASQPIIAERPSYFNLNTLGGTVTGGHNTIGVMGPLGN